MPPRIRAIVIDVAHVHGVPIDRMMSHERTRILARARWDVWRRIRSLDDPPSFPLIGRWFDRDHTTIIHGVYHD